MYALFPFLLAAACSDSTTVADLSVSHDLAKADLAGIDLAGIDLAAVDLAQPATYPAGPYGNTVGATIPPLVWEGYADPLADALANTKPYGAYTMNDLRLSGRRYAVVHVSAFS
jgi:hypothetical protein